MHTSNIQIILQVVQVRVILSNTTANWVSYNTVDDVFAINSAFTWSPATGIQRNVTGRFEAMSRLRHSAYLNKYTSGEYGTRAVRFAIVDITGTSRSYAGAMGTITHFQSAYDFFYNFRNNKFYISGHNNGTGYASYVHKDGVFFVQNIINITPTAGDLALTTSGIDHKRNYIFNSVYNLGSGGGVNCSLYILNMNTDTLVGTYTFTTVAGETGVSYCMYSTYLDRYLIVPRSATCGRIKVFNPNTLTFGTDITLGVNVNTALTNNLEELLFALSETNPAMS